MHRFCTGQGKSYAIFINPKGRRTRNLDVLAIAQSCKAKVRWPSQRHLACLAIIQVVGFPCS